MIPPARNRVLWGGRGSTKTVTFAKFALRKAMKDPAPIGCFRELQNSIRDSVLAVLKEQVVELDLEDCFDMGDNYLRCINGCEFIFKGLRTNINEVKGIQGLQLAWVEEAQGVSRASWKILRPTIRKEGSEIWAGFNPDHPTDPVYEDYITNPPPRTLSAMLNWNDNPWFPPDLEEQRLHDLRTDPEGYEHTWNGGFKTRSAAMIFSGKWRVSRFDDPPPDVRLLFGADWGFAQDPTALIRCYIIGATLYIDRELFRIGLEIRDTADAFRTIPGAEKATIRADSARPETISHVRNDKGRTGDKPNLNVVGAEKWPGSVEDGIAFIRGFDEIVIHERCVNLIREATLYKYKEDRLTGEVLTDIVDKHNHGWDAVRYALGLLIKRSGPGRGFLEFLKQQDAAKQEEQRAKEATQS